jgi:Xaa-Pro aminopeptidase
MDALINRARATQILSAANLDALLVSHPLNVYYATNKRPVLDRMTTTHQSLAVIPREATAPIVCMGSGFEYYYNASDTGLAPGVLPYLVVAAAADPLNLGESAVMRVLDKAPLDARELRRRRLTGDARFFPSIGAALAAALGQLGLTHAKIGYDSLVAQALLATAAPAAGHRAAEDLIRHIRLIKTPAELALMRAAAAANAEAGLAAARGARSAASLQGLRRLFFSEAAQRGNTPVFMLVDGVMDEAYDEALEEGRGFLIDCVSHCGFYEGDYARTVVLGEPNAELRRVVAAIGTAWDTIRARLQPGLAFSEIRRIGRETLAKHGYDYTVAFKPHIVGLSHEDQPLYAIDGGALDLALMEGMVLSVDCPLLDVGVGCSAHLEDLMLITADGSEALNATGNHLIVA